jgi:alkanesulfonate monooxygenase SsuD/methylene tetrahydromethanopterin reductase-like flavin-dependent oxidoreductase (luciferase family)
VGRLGDGWLPSFCTPDDVTEGRPVVEAEAAAHDRAIDPEHWGALVAYVAEEGPLPEPLAAAVAARRPGADPGDVIPAGLDALRTAVERFIGVGVSKFVLVPVVEPDDWNDHLAEVAGATLDLVT